MGIKYVMSGANEKADVKSMIPKYLIGVAFVVMCSLIASSVANIANKDGTNDAGGIVGKGFELAGMKVGTVTPPEGEKKQDDVLENTSTNFYVANLSSAQNWAMDSRFIYGAEGELSTSDIYDETSKRLTFREYKNQAGVVIAKDQYEYKEVDGKQVLDKIYHSYSAKGQDKLNLVATTNVKREENGTDGIVTYEFAFEGSSRIAGYKTIIEYDLNTYKTNSIERKEVTKYGGGLPDIEGESSKIDNPEYLNGY